MIDEVFPCKMIMAILYSEQEVLDQCLKELQQQYGPIDHQCDVYPFDHTSYYNEEMGENLYKVIFSFEKLVDPQELAQLKIDSMAMEDQYKTNNKRSINLDPGLIARGRLILASTKDFSHRIYLSQGIYAEVTFLFKKGRIEALPWSYPDYIHPDRSKALLAMNKRYLKQITP